MSKPHQNITTLLIPDPNGGQPQVIKVLGGKGGQLPFQLTGVGAGVSSSASNVKPTFIKTTGDQGQTVIQASKLPTGQIIAAMPARQGLGQQGVSVHGVRSRVVMPANSIQLKSPVRNLTSSLLEQQSQPLGTAVVTARSGSLTSPVVIRTQTSPLTTVPTTLHTSNTTHTHGNVNTLTQANSTPQMQTNINGSQLQQSHNQQPIGTGVTPPKSLITTPILDHTGARKRRDLEFDYGIEAKRRKTEKGGKGLRHFSMKVCEKVKAKGTTSYNEVADELVSEFTDPSRCSSPSDGTNYDQKNIRRRVYDALNVLMAMSIISKEKKEIRWLGLPTNSAQECHKLEQERRNRIERIKLKTQQLQDLILQQIAFKNLVERNRNEERLNGLPSLNSAIQLPFIIVNTSKKTVIDCSISNDKTEYLFSFDDTFEIHDDIEVLKRMGMALGLEKGQCSPADLERAKSLIPEALQSYVIDLAEGQPEPKVNMREDLDAHGDLQEDIEAVGVLGTTRGSLVEGGGSAISSFGSVSGTAGSCLSRHSSFASLSHDPRAESASPSSFGDDEDDDLIEESDVD